MVVLNRAKADVGENLFHSRYHAHLLGILAAGASTNFFQLGEQFFRGTLLFELQTIQQLLLSQASQYLLTPLA
jgi:hypothetical protein